MALTPYSGPWTKETANHLLRRTVFGPKKEEIERAESEGLQTTLDRLFTLSAAPDPPINYKDNADNNVPIGETWVNSFYNGVIATRIRRFTSLTAWQLKNIHESEMTIEGKMLSFWHNHFPVEYPAVIEPRYHYMYWETLRRNALGNFQTFVEEITVDPAMLRYLDGRSNTSRSPNENYARELLELFTIGKGDLAGPGDYTTFTEDDVIEVAKIMTGWVEQGYNSQRIETPYSEFVLNRHDRTTKKLSHRFGEAEIQDAGADEYKNLIAVIFQQDEVAKYISRKLYRHFVATEISSDIESEIIEPLADLIRGDNYEIKNGLRALLESQHFFDQLEVLGGIITNPIEFTFDIMRVVASNMDELEVLTQYTFWERVYLQLNSMEMAYFNPPDVAGWPAYYLEPQFSEIWVSSVTVKHRLSLINTIFAPNGIRLNQEVFRLELLDMIAGMQNPSDPNSLIEELATIFFSAPLTIEQRDAIKEIFIPGLPDYEWTVEYEDYLADPSNRNLRNAILNRLSSLFTNLTIIPEFQVM